MKKVNPIILFIEIIGAIVVFFVGLALISSPMIYVDGMPIAGISIYVLYTLAVIVMILTIFRHHLVPFEVNSTVLTISGIVLLIAGASTSYLMPDFFSWAASLDMMYWLRVSIYSIPAICIEGATFTLFIVWFENRIEYRSDRENALMVITFVLYATFTVMTNFLAINKTITVSEHIAFLKMATAVIIALTVGHIVFRKQNIK